MVEYSQATVFGTPIETYGKSRASASHLSVLCCRQRAVWKLSDGKIPLRAPDLAVHSGTYKGTFTNAALIGNTSMKTPGHCCRIILAFTSVTDSLTPFIQFKKKVVFILSNFIPYCTTGRKMILSIDDKLSSLIGLN